MRKVKINGIAQKLTRIKRELYAIGPQFADADNYLMARCEEESDRIGALIDEINEWKESL
jgi:cob(I)alamin adenosyltransferase